MLVVEEVDDTLIRGFRIRNIRIWSSPCRIFWEYPWLLALETSSVHCILCCMLVNIAVSSCSSSNSFGSFLGSSRWMVYWSSHSVAFQCPQCNKRFVSEVKLMNHNKNKNSTCPRFMCPECDSCFCTQRALDEHVNCHERMESVGDQIVP